MNTKRIGFACKWIDHAGQTDGIKATDPAREYNTGTTTITWLNRQTRDVAEQKLWELIEANILATHKLVERVGNLDESLRMVRLSSDILPAYTHSDFKSFYHQADVRNLLERQFGKLGELAKVRNVRISFHPGQFTVLASDNDEIVARSIEEFEYHADMARYMGYGQQFQDMKINVHIAGRRGADGIRAVYPKLSPEARNTITIENEEMKHGLDDCLALSDILPIVLDVHHHFVREGTYIDVKDPRIARVLYSWRDVRPTVHYSISREDYLINHDVDTCPDHATLLENGYKKSKMRAHSDFMWNRAVNEWMYQHWQWADVMVEAKGKNLASFQLYEFWKSLENHM